MERYGFVLKPLELKRISKEKIMIRIIENWGALPIQCPVESNLEFHPGKFVTVGKTLSISDGFHNDGIVDDINSSQYRYCCAKLIKKNNIYKNSKNKFEYKLNILSNESLIQDSVLIFSNVKELLYSGLELTEFKLNEFDQRKFQIIKNKIIFFENLEELYSGQNFYIYIFYVVNKCFRDSFDYGGFSESTIIGSNRATVWNKPMIYSTDMFEFEKLLTYKKYQKLYVRNGLLTNEKWNVRLESVGFLIDIDSGFNMTVYKS